MSFKIFSYNIHGLPFLPDLWTTPLAEWFKDCDYDFVCLQEVFTVGRSAMLTTALEENGYTVIHPNDFSQRKNLIGSGLVFGLKNSSWRVIDSGFIQYNESAGAELMANKGFQWITVESLKTNQNFIMINTHMQSDNPTNYFGGCLDTRPIRKAQAQQIVDYLESAPRLRCYIIGDLNSEEESHDELVWLTSTKDGLKKHTFEPTGEDLDHVAICPKFWNGFPLPKILELNVLSKLWWSDHWPIHVMFTL